MPHFDDIVLGAGMGGLSVAALLARSGRRVLVLEAHDVPGGYAHTFDVRGQRFCAQVHYIFGCGAGEGVHSVLAKLGLVAQVPFVRLDPEGFDHVVVAGERFRIPNGLSKFRERLLQRFPGAELPIRRYFQVIAAIDEELTRSDELPDRITPWTLLGSGYRFRHLLRYRHATLEQLFDRVRMPNLVRAILAGQSGDYLLPPRDVSLLLHVALVCGYDRGAYYPRFHYHQFVESIAGVIRGAPGSELLLGRKVERIHVSNGRVTSVSTTDGTSFTAERFISNIDPRRTAALAGGWQPSRADQRRLDYEYSASTFSMYLVLSGLDLREYGFGSYNVWRYPHPDLNRIYDDQLLANDLTNPWLFLSTPTLHSDEPGICPPGRQILEVATACDYGHFARLRRDDRRAYYLAKNRIRENVLDILEAEFVPNLRRHLELRLTGTGPTNERYCGAPEGNAYGARLTPRHVGPERRPYRTSLDNLWMVGATAGFPSVAGTIGAGARLYRELTGDGV